MELINRELSWLSFNERVLQESLDATVPLVERIRFLGIYSNNMDEFFRVRVASVNRMIALKDKRVEGFDGSPKALLDEIQLTVKKQRRVFDLAYQRIMKELESRNVIHVNEKTVNEVDRIWLSEYFSNDLKQDIVPIILDKKRKFPRLQDKGIYLAVKFSIKRGKVQYALIQIPSSHDRFKSLPGKKNEEHVILLDDIIRLHLGKIFSIFKYDKIEAYTFKFTRDAELDLDDDISISMMEKMEDGIKNRKKGEPVRFIYDENMPGDLLKFLMDALGIEKDDHIAPSGRYHNFKDFMRFPNFNNPDFVYENLPPLNHPELENQKSVIKTVQNKDILLHYPYQKFDYIVDLLREAAIDPKVKSIKINIYRVAKRSQVINALVNAIKNGKKVTVVVELQARFDEENNMYWSNILREQGAKLIYGVPSLKVHSKLIHITRISGKKTQFISHVGTGNFHGGTAKIYGDFGLLTSNIAITKEVDKVFTLLENNIDRGIYRSLMVSPFNTRRKFIELITRETRNAKKGLPAKIDIKLNNLVDKKMITKLYDASKAGVKVRIICRGICCLVPGVKKQSENIEVISIVDRFLEHTRFFIFHNNGKPEFFISSADWMTRNLDKRIEVSAPILDESIQAEIAHIFEIQWKDTAKARVLDISQRNKYIKPESGQEPFRSQYETYNYYRDLLEKSQEN